MKRKNIEKMILDIVCEVDYDHYKEFLPECAEEPEYIEKRMNVLVKIVEKHLASDEKKLKSKIRTK